jgi:hypothetical protein
MLTGMDVAELQRELGGVVIESAYLERVLRATFSALIGSKYAAVIDGRMTAHGLMEDCQHIVKVHTHIGAARKSALADALADCMAVNAKRNRVIHDAWAYRPGDVMVTVQSQRDSQDVTVKAWTMDELHDLANRISAAANALAAAVTSAFGPDGLRVEDQLRQELGRDIEADLA